jgi:hypothetical protein
MGSLGSTESLLSVAEDVPPPRGAESMRKWLQTSKEILQNLLKGTSAVLKVKNIRGRYTGMSVRRQQEKAKAHREHVAKYGADRSLFDMGISRS